MTKRILLLFLLLPISLIIANRYNAKCSTTSDCDQNQQCYNRVCLCNKVERRFWTGEICAICVEGFTVTDDRCYQRIGALKTWSEARQYCRDRYADLFTWRDNKDQQFIEPIAKDWLLSSAVLEQQLLIQNMTKSQHYIAWAGAKITSVNPHTTQWMDRAGIQLTFGSSEWCDPTSYAGYILTKEPTSGTRQTSGTEREECVTFNIGTSANNFLCLADDYCSKKYPFICEMNAASMELANSVLHGSDGNDINFEQQVPVAPTSYPDTGPAVGPNPSYGIDPNYNNNAAALSASSSSKSSMTTYIFIGVAILLIIGGIVGFIMIRKKKQVTTTQMNKGEEAGEGRSSFTSSVGSMVE